MGHGPVYLRSSGGWLGRWWPPATDLPICETQEVAGSVSGPLAYYAGRTRLILAIEGEYTAKYNISNGGLFMGQPMDRSRRVFGKLAPFDEVFPELEDAAFEFVEKDFVFEKRRGTWHLNGQGGVMPCGNPSCRRGGYELDRDLRQMLRAGVLRKKFELSCRGDEGSPLGRKIGRKCHRSVEGTLKLRLKVPAAAV